MPKIVQLGFGSNCPDFRILAKPGYSRKLNKPGDPIHFSGVHRWKVDVRTIRPFCVGSPIV